MVRYAYILLNNYVHTKIHNQVVSNHSITIITMHMTNKKIS